MAGVHAEPLDHGHGHDPALHHQYEDIGQQNESYLIGMWTFLVTEVMFFGALFFTYSLERWNYQYDFWVAHEHCDVTLGATNTTILLFSSFTMVLAVQAAQLKKREHVIGYLLATVACACGFLIIKSFEYTSKFMDRLYPGINFTTSPEVFHNAPNVNMNHAQMFYGLYFAMTGLHGVHVLVGIGVLLALVRLWVIRAKSVTLDFIPTELCGLYWHFVDLVWIFLFPLFYLMPKPGH